MQGGYCQILSLSPSYSLEAESLTEPGALSPTYSTMVTGTYKATCSFFYGWVLGTQIPVLMLGQVRAVAY